jgi:hypothetical protein
LLRIAAGLVQPDAGERLAQPGATIQYLSQEPDLSGFGAALMSRVGRAIEKGAPRGSWKSSSTPRQSRSSAATRRPTHSLHHKRRRALQRAVPIHPTGLNSSRPRLARCAPFPEVSGSPAKPLTAQRPDRVRTPAFQPIRAPWRKRRNRLVAARIAVVKPFARRNLSPPDSITLAAVNATTGPADVLSGTSNFGLPQGPPVFLAVARGAARPQRKTAWLNHRAR